MWDTDSSQGSGFKDSAVSHHRSPFFQLLQPQGCVCFSTRIAICPPCLLRASFQKQICPHTPFCFLQETRASASVILYSSWPSEVGADLEPGEGEQRGHRWVAGQVPSPPVPELGSLRSTHSGWPANLRRMNKHVQEFFQAAQFRSLMTPPLLLCNAQTSWITFWVNIFVKYIAYCFPCIFFFFNCQTLF